MGFIRIHGEVETTISECGIETSNVSRPISLPVCMRHAVEMDPISRKLSSSLFVYM